MFYCITYKRSNLFFCLYIPINGEKYLAISHFLILALRYIDNETNTQVDKQTSQYSRVVQFAILFMFY